MASNFEMIQEFNRAMEVPHDPNFERADISLLVDKLISEETKELFDELHVPRKVDKVKLAKELADLLYVTYYMADVYEIPIDRVYAEVHKSNMSKLDENGKPIRREDGKILKGPNYRPPELNHIFK